MRFKKILSKDIEETLNADNFAHMGRKVLQSALISLTPNGLCSIRFDADSDDEIDDIVEQFLAPLKGVLQDTGISGAIKCGEEGAGYIRYLYLPQNKVRMLPISSDSEDFDIELLPPNDGGHSDGVFADIGFNMGSSFDFSIKKILCSEFMNDTESRRKISDHILENGILWDCIFRIDQDSFSAAEINNYIQRLSLKTPFFQAFPDGENSRLLTYMMVFEELQTNHEIQNHYFDQQT